jgi:hypothetical protein
MLLRHCICASANAPLGRPETMSVENIGRGFMMVILLPGEAFVGIEESDK